jgi:hypothetical protein
MPATGLAQKDVAAVSAALTALIGRERQGVSPFTGAPMTFKARPVRNVVRARPLTAFSCAIKINK